MSYGCTKMVHFLGHLEILRKFWFWNNTMCGYFGLGGGKTPKQLFVPGFWWPFCRSLPLCVLIELFAESWECRCSHGRSGIYEDVVFNFSDTLSCWARYIGIIEKSKEAGQLTSFLPWRSGQAVEKKAVSLKRKHPGYGDIPFWNRSYFTWIFQPLNFSHSRSLGSRQIWWNESHKSFLESRHWTQGREPHHPFGNEYYHSWWENSRLFHEFVGGKRLIW